MVELMLCVVILCESRCIAHVRVEKAAFPSKKETVSLFIPEVKKMLWFYHDFINCVHNFGNAHTFVTSKYLLQEVTGTSNCVCGAHIFEGFILSVKRMIQWPLKRNVYVMRCANKTLVMLSGNHSLKAAEEKQRVVTETPWKFKYRIIAEACKVQGSNNTRGSRSIHWNHKRSFNDH